MSDTYKILRFYQRSHTMRETVRTGLTLEEARKHCNDPDTQSKTCMTEEGMQRTAEKGPWFEGYDPE